MSVMGKGEISMSKIYKGIDYKFQRCISRFFNRFLKAVRV